MILVIGNKRYSSWSLRPWLLMKHFNLPFEERLVPLDLPTSDAELKRYSPSGKVPVLIDGENTIWESLAIAEYLNEKFAEKQMWPADRAARAHARCVSNEMHSGFMALRTHMPHDLQKKLTNFDISPAAQKDIERIKNIWLECLQKSGGPFLFGSFSIADAMFAPVVNRVVSYGVPFDGDCATYIQQMRALPAHQEWINEALKETLVMARYR
jgi:glutathione S-transferase